MKRQNECYFFGTFNPPHLGHLNLAKSVREKFGYKKIIFMPNFMPCHKKSDITPNDRLNMLKLLPIKGWGEVSDAEFRLPVPSYTFQTVQNLYEGSKIHFIIGYDAFINIEKWKNPDILKEKLCFIVLKRKGQTTRQDILKLRDKGFEFTLADDIDFINISSCRIRQNVQNGVSIKGMVTREVEEYIYDKGIYKKLA